MKTSPGRVSLLLSVFLLNIFLAACGGGGSGSAPAGDPPQPDTDLLALSALEEELAGFTPSRLLTTGTVQMHVQGTTTGNEVVNADALVNWLSSDESVVRVGTNGLVTGIGPGIATISANWAKGNTRLSSSRVFQVRNITLDLSAPINPVRSGIPLTLTVTANWDDGTPFVLPEVTFSSTDEAVASFDTPALPQVLSTHQVGEVEITAGYRSFTATLIVTVLPAVTYSIGGSITGYTGSGLELTLNGGNNKVVTASDTSFSFDTALADNTPFMVAVAKQPVGPHEVCAVKQTTTVVHGGNVTDVAINCEPARIISGSVQGLKGNGLSLLNNGTDTLVLAANDTQFEFVTKLVDSSPYHVTIKDQPAAPYQTCHVSHNHGTVSGVDITGIKIECLDNRHEVQTQALSEEVVLSWPETGADSYNIFYSTDPQCNLGDIFNCADGNRLQGGRSPLKVTGLINGLGYYFWVSANHGQIGVMAPRAYARPDRIVVNHTVKDMTVDADGNVYLGGSFKMAGAYQGGGYQLRIAAGGREGNFPLVDGTIYAVVADGQGGWFIGGAFDQVGGINRKNIAHIMADGSVDAAWDPQASGIIRTMATQGTELIVGGSFRPINGQPSIGGQLRNRLALLDIDKSSPTYGLASAWDPSVITAGNAAKGAVLDIRIQGNGLFVAGEFDQVGTEMRNNIALVNRFTGDVMPWNPDADGIVNTVVLAGAVVYVGGEFSNIGGQPRTRLAALDPITGFATDWNPAISHERLSQGNPATKVSSLTLDGLRLYVGGVFDTVNGEERHHLAAFHIGTGLLEAWSPTIDGATSATVNNILVQGDQLYVAGYFETINGVDRFNLASLDVLSGEPSPWNPAVGNAVYALAVNENTLYVGGRNGFINGMQRSHLASLTPMGQLRDWNPGTDGLVETLVVEGSMIYFGGFFEHTAGQPRLSLAAVDAVTGALSDWNPQAAYAGISSTIPGWVYSLAIDAGVVYVGGGFDSLGGQQRNYLGAVDATTGLATAWLPASPNSTLIYDIAVQNNIVYLGGGFSSFSRPPAADQVRRGLAAVDADPDSVTFGELTDWNPAATYNIALTTYSGTVYDILLDGDRLFVAGRFEEVGSAPRNSLAALDLTTGLASDWDPNPDYSVSALTMVGNALAVGGDFYNIGTASGRQRIDSLAVIDIDPDSVNYGQPTGWRGRPLVGHIETLLSSGGRLHVGGGFIRVDSGYMGSYYDSLVQ